MKAFDWLRSGVRFASDWLGQRVPTRKKHIIRIDRKGTNHPFNDNSQVMCFSSVSGGGEGERKTHNNLDVIENRTDIGSDNSARYREAHILNVGRRLQSGKLDRALLRRSRFSELAKEIASGNKPFPEAGDDHQIDALLRYDPVIRLLLSQGQL